MSTSTLTPILLFTDGQAQAALDLYVSVFEDGEALRLEHVPEGDEGAGLVQSALIRVAGQQLLLMDSVLPGGFAFNPATSLFVRCGSAEEQQRIWAALREGGEAVMEFDDYGFGPFGWCVDRFGVSWQLALA